MPIVPIPSPSGSALSIPTNLVYDYEYDEAGKPLAGQELVVTLFPTQGAASIAPTANLNSLRYKVLTGADGKWQLLLIPNANISVPTGGAASFYALSSPSRGASRFVVPSPPGSYQASQNPAP